MSDMTKTTTSIAEVKMIEDMGPMRQRLANYNNFPDRHFRTDSGRPAADEDVSQKLRQYWADKNIPSTDKLKGFDFDLSTFDPRKTSFKELREISNVLIGMGIIDHTTASCLTGPGSDFDRYGKQVNLETPVDAIEYFNRNLELLKEYVAEGHDFANDTLVILNTAITVMLALHERATAMKANGSISFKA